MRLFVSVLIAKLGYFLIKKLGLGSGYVWPGHIALIFYPNLLADKRIKYSKGIVFISGTNGKTTTSKLITHVLESNNYSVTHNKTGANLLNGIAASILLDFSLFKGPKADVGVFEIDEFALPHLLKKISPDALLLLNLSRDQLDRYGEVDIVFDEWYKALGKLSKNTALILDSEQRMFKGFKNTFNGRIFYFDSDMHNLDKTKLHGSFNAKNVNAAVLTSHILGLNELEVVNSLQTFEAAYGRGEIIELEGLYLQLFLAKNPSSFNNNLDLFVNTLHPDTLLFILNDEVRDGRDISWIYDIEPAKIKKACEGKNIYVSGLRYLDMAVRLKYAGVEVPSDHLFPHIVATIHHMKSSGMVKEVVALPNYSAMLELRKVLTGKEIL